MVQNTQPDRRAISVKTIDDRRDFTTGKIGKKLILLAFPLIAGMLLQTAYNVVDSIFIGFLGPEEIAAVAITFPVVFIFIGVASGLGIGATALISRAVGAKKLDTANNFAEHSFLFALILGVLIAISGIIFSRPLFVFMGATPEVLALAIQYSQVIFIGMVFMFVGFIAQSVLQSEGNSKTPMIFLSVSVVLNVILDPIFIFGFGMVPAMGLFGAALATMLSRFVWAILCIRFILSKKSMIRLEPRCFKLNPDIIKRIAVVGIPSALSQSVTAIGFIVITSIVGSFGTFALAAYGIGMRLNSVVVLSMIGLSRATATFVGQNVGAGEYGRARSVVWFSAKISFVISLFFFIAMILFPEYFFLPFTRNAEVLKIGAGYLSIIAYSYLAFGFYFIFASALDGAGKTTLTLAANIVYYAIAIILAYFLSELYGLQGVWVSSVIAILIELVIIFLIFQSNIWMPRGKNLKTNSL